MATSSGCNQLTWVPAGWVREHYVEECERMAAVCRDNRPDLAAEWTRRAEAIRALRADSKDSKPR